MGQSIADGLSKLVAALERFPRQSDCSFETTQYTSKMIIVAMSRDRLIKIPSYKDFGK